MTVAALIVAAGTGERFGGAIPKQYAMLAGKPVLRWSLDRFLDHPGISTVMVVIQPDHRSLYDAAVRGLNLPDPISGGGSRQESVRLGLEAVAEKAPEFVLVHDAARPLVTSAIIDGVLTGLQRDPGAIAAMPVTDTLHRGRTDMLEETVDRASLWRAQTPQGFHYSRLLAAHRSATNMPMTDDAAVARYAGMPVGLVPGSEENFKVTTAEDLDRAERLLASASDIRTGLGFDVHRFTSGDSVILCGIRIPHDAALEGHSDADVGLHALTDAILGAIGGGDIGMLFPPTDPRWRGTDSAIFLGHAVELVQQRGGQLVNVDVTFMCEAPKIGPHRQAMVMRMAALLGVTPERVNVKATTTERLGFTGRREGIAAQAIATVRLPR